MRTRRVGRHGLLVECAGIDEVTATYAELRRRADELDASDIVPAASTVLLDGLRDPDSTERLLGTWVQAPAARPGSAGDLVELPVTYDGPDVAEVARQWQVDTAEVTRIHRDTEFVVAFCGFSPGFAYCTGLPDGLTVRRRAEPRTSVPAGSVGLAGEFTGVYPAASPGGWQLIGSTPVSLWRPDAERPALLEPGTRVRFVDA